MKNFLLPLLLLCMLASCKKEYSAYTEPNTTNSDTTIVKRLVMVNGSDSIAYDFSYDEDRRISKIYITDVVGGSVNTSSDTFYRDAATENIVKSVLVLYDIPNNYTYETYYTYSPSGQLQARIQSEEYSPGYRDSTVMIYGMGILKGEINYSVTPSGYNVDGKSVYTVVATDRITEIFDSNYVAATGNFAFVSSDFFLYEDTVANPLQLKNANDRLVLRFADYSSFNDYPWINFFAPVVFKKETYQTNYSSDVLTFEFSPYQVQSGRPVRAAFTKSTTSGDEPMEVRYYYPD